MKGAAAVTKLKTLEESDGCDQLERPVGAIVAGDRVTLQYRGKYVHPTKENKTVEFEDMFHSEKKLHFTVGGDGEDTNNEGILRGLEQSVRLMVLGEKARLLVPSVSGFGAEEHRGYVAKVPANSDLILDVTVKSVCRNNVIHNRKQPKNTTVCCIWKVLYCFTRAY